MKYLRSLVFLVIFSLLFTANSTVIAQTIPQNMSNVDVSSYSDVQIRSMLQRAQANGISDSQLIQQTQDRGLPADQVQLLRKRIVAARQSNTNGSDVTNNNESGARKLSAPSDTLSD
jgi:hypothetical protein